jgi:hypothetical protein
MPAPLISHAPVQSRGAIAWKPTKIMNMRDLSKDDDFLSHLLVEKLGTGAVPLLVHKMDPSRRLPKTDADDLLMIVRRVSIFSPRRVVVAYTNSNLFFRVRVSAYGDQESRRYSYSSSGARPPEVGVASVVTPRCSTHVLVFQQFATT